MTWGQQRMINVQIKHSKEVPSWPVSHCLILMCGCVGFQVCGDLQSTDGHQGGPTGHHHLGHSDRTEEERLPLREFCTLAYF